MERHYLVSSLEFRKKLKNVSDSEYRRLREAYDDFLEQPLKLEMFVPCDEDGNVISKFYSEKENTKNLTFSQLSNQYQIAETKVLFEGFEITDETEFLISKYGFSLYFNQIEDFNVEQLLTWSNEIQLTENAIKQIGL